MRIAVQADDGDEVAISADFVSVERALVTLEIENMLYSDVGDFNHRESTGIGKRPMVGSRRNRSGFSAGYRILPFRAANRLCNAGDGSRLLSNNLNVLLAAELRCQAAESYRLFRNSASRQNNNARPKRRKAK